ncbi:Zn-dependent protease with chaperone function [Geitlerinema sp. FC II]|nr:M48 family metallopeptidase [Geitlerinema sp. CS-897]PPT10482.1 Zn-dependent protease with chaperone function [Geitlerinema sp. FC II]
MKYTPKEITEEVNVSKVHPLINFGYLIATVVGITLVLYFGLGLAVDWFVPRISDRREKEIGDALAPTVPAQFAGEEIESDARLAYLEDLVETLRKPGDMAEIPLDVHLIDTPIVNAAALAGGHVFVTTSFLEEVESENELAFVLAHEIGHLSARDALKGMGRSLVVLFGAIVLDFGTSGTTGTPDIVLQTINLNSLNYSRKQEYAADVYGLESVVRVYGHGSNSLDFFERLAETESQFPNRVLTVSEYFQTHPLTQNRIDALNSLASDRGWTMEGELIPPPDGLGCPNFQCEE